MVEIKFVLVVGAVCLLSFGMILWWMQRRYVGLREELAETIASLRTTHVESLVTQEDGHREHIGRLKREHEKALQRASFATVQAMLPGLDALSQASAAMAQLSEKEEEAEGLVLVERVFLQGLASQDVTPIAPAPGMAFSPQLHEAVGVCETDDVAPGTIAQLLRVGWSHPAGLLRPATVQTASALTLEQPPEETSKPAMESEALPEEGA